MWIVEPRAANGKGRFLVIIFWWGIEPCLGVLLTTKSHCFDAKIAFTFQHWYIHLLIGWRQFSQGSRFPGKVLDRWIKIVFHFFSNNANLFSILLKFCSNHSALVIVWQLNESPNLLSQVSSQSSPSQSSPWQPWVHHDRASTTPPASRESPRCLNNFSLGVHPVSIIVPNVFRKEI